MRKYIFTDPNIQGGEPCLKGTRTPVAVILHLFKNGYTVDQIHELYPWISTKVLKTNLKQEVVQTNL